MWRATGLRDMRRALGIWWLDEPLGGEGAEEFLAGGAKPAVGKESVVIFVLVILGSRGKGAHPCGMAAKLGGEEGTADERLFEVVGEEVGEELPEGAEDGVGGGVEAA